MAWAAILDGDYDGADERATLVEAEQDAAFLARHPARRDRAAHGYGEILVLEIERDEWTGEMVPVISWYREACARWHKRAGYMVIM